MKTTKKNSLVGPDLLLECNLQQILRFEILFDETLGIPHTNYTNYEHGKMCPVKQVFVAK